MEKGIESAPPAAAAGTPPPLGNSLGNSLGSGACARCQRSFSGRLSSGHRGRIREEREEEEERSDAENPGSAWGPSCNLPKSMNPHPRGSSASPCPGCWIYGISCAQGRLQLPSHSLESALLRPRHGDGRGAIPKAFSQNEPRQGARHGLGWARSPQDGHGAPGMGTDQNLLPQEMPGCPCQPQALLRSQKLLLSWRSGIIPTKQPGLGHFEISLGSWGRRRHRRLPGDESMVCANSHRAERSRQAPARESPGKALEKRLQRLPLNSKHGMLRVRMDGGGRAGKQSQGGICWSQFTRENHREPLGLG